MNQETNRLVEFRATSLLTDQEWATDPDLLIIQIPEKLIYSLPDCLELMKKNHISSVTLFGFDSIPVSCKCYELVDYEAGECHSYTPHFNSLFAPMTPDYELTVAEISMDDQGNVEFHYHMKDQNDMIKASLGTYHSLLTTARINA